MQRNGFKQAQRLEFEMMWGWGTGWMFLWMALFWVGTILLVVWGVRQLSAGDTRGGRRALEILEERYARGDIDRDEFESRRRHLRR